MKLDRHSTTVRLIRVCVVIFATIAALLAMPARSHAAVTLVAPAQGVQLPWIQLRPPVAFDIASDETPKWVLIATDPEMTQTVRYCRQFGAQFITSSWHWACDAWSVGTDPYGYDIVRPLVGGTQIYYWQVVYTSAPDADGKTTELKSDVRAFTIEAMPAIESASAISDRVFGTVLGDGTNLNVGAAAFVNSGLKVNTIKSARIRPNRFQIGVTFTGGVDMTRSFVLIKSKAGTRRLPLLLRAANAGLGTWTLSRGEWRLKTRVYDYQAYLYSTKNHALVRSEHRVIVIKRTKRHPSFTRV